LLRDRLHAVVRRSATEGGNAEEVPLDGVVKDEWQDLVLDERHGGRVNRIPYESISIGSSVYTLTVIASPS